MQACLVQSRFDARFRGLAERFAMPVDACRQPDFFRATPADTAQRMLANLLNSYARLGDSGRCRCIQAYLKILQETTS